MMFKRLIRLIILLFIQIVIMNNIHLLGCITPLPIAYMLVCFRNDTSRMVLLLYGFATGLLYDVFSNTSGMASFSLTLLAMMQPAIMRLFAPRDIDPLFTPTVVSMRFWPYISYVFACMLVAHASFYLLDAFTLRNLQLTLIAIAGSSVLATCFCVIYDLIIRKK